ncbi:Ubiquinone biosynthesis protein coq9, mitochondrial [Erysiphe neolycopersici]|uniref:Ubiquinone biosynthesis protein n=1 Tax=Erysiphe neolycopersici TaxID=212602 RepID=A0A420HWY5_9PEZI|nr:Ubiquinone biosynthesis protein coq9, mitochondrial [Erysiphe neolycopersici]
MSSRKVSSITSIAITATTTISQPKTAPILCQKLQRCVGRTFSFNQHQHRFQLRQYHSYDHSPPPGPFTSLQSQILSSAITHVPNHGFTQISLSRGANDIGLIDATINLFPAGPFSLVHYHLFSQRLALQSRLRQTNEEELRGIGAKVKALTWWRLEANRDIIHCWSEVCLLRSSYKCYWKVISKHYTNTTQALALMALTSNIQIAIKELSLLMDEIWYLSGDDSVDTSWYTKRASLAAIYTSTELFMTTDKSADFKETKQFLERRLIDMQKVGSTLGAVGQWGSFTASAVLNTLRSKGMPI